MPLVKCPLCGDVNRLNVNDAKAWHATYYPNIPAGELVPHRCFDCWDELNDGDRVEIRGTLSAKTSQQAGQQGSLTRILTSTTHGSIYEVRLDAGREGFFTRAELKKLKVKPGRKT